MGEGRGGAGAGRRQTECGGSRALREDQTPAQPSPEEIKQACCCAVHYFLSQVGSSPALATRPFSPGSSADPRLARLRADQPVSWKSKGIAVS